MQLKFIKDEFGIDLDVIKNINIDEWQKIREKCADIECNEAVNIFYGDYDDTSREDIAASIVNIKFKNLFS